VRSLLPVISRLVCHPRTELLYSWFSFRSISHPAPVSAGLPGPSRLRPTLSRRALFSLAQEGVLGLHFLASAATLRDNLRPLTPIRVRPSDSWYRGTGYVPSCDTRGFQTPAETLEACPHSGTSPLSTPPRASAPLLWSQRPPRKTATLTPSVSSQCSLGRRLPFM